MNKISNINLGGYPFTIDDDAFDHLERYLDTIHRHFRDSEGYEDITADIEARMAELFQEQLNGRPIVTLRDVKNAISIMGTPEEFGAEPIEEPAAAASASKSEYKTGKRLFRDVDNKMIGGVCSGLAAYFGMQDPLWMRIFFVIIVLTFGFGIPLYFILWMITPEATSTSDRLAMKGEPINVSNIAKSIEEEIGKLSDQLSELGGEWNMGGKKKSTREEISFGTPFRKGFL